MKKGLLQNAQVYKMKVLLLRREKYFSAKSRNAISLFVSLPQSRLRRASSLVRGSPFYTFFTLESIAII